MPSTLARCKVGRARGKRGGGGFSTAITNDELLLRLVRQARKQRGLPLLPTLRETAVVVLRNEMHEKVVYPMGKD
jgi:hypothetical protein